MSRPHLASSLCLLAAFAVSAGCTGTTSVDGPVELRMVEVGVAAGVDWVFTPVNPMVTDFYDHGTGLVADDIDGDGHADLLLLNQCGQTGLYYGRGDGTFRDESARLDMISDGVRVGVALGDYDNDRDTDILVTFTRRAVALLRQNDDGSFTDVAAEVGITADGHYSGADFADIDADGDLDLVVAGNVGFTTDELVPATERCQAFYRGEAGITFDDTPAQTTLLFINQGADASFSFVEEATARGVPTELVGGVAPGAFADAFFADFDGDGDPDLMMPEMFGNTILMRNDGTGNFTDATADWTPQPSFGPISMTVNDYDGDQRFDAYYTDMHSDMWIAGTAGSGMVPFSTVNPHERYKGLHGPASGVGDNPVGPIYGNGLWVSGGTEAGAPRRDATLELNAETFQPWGHTPADFDNDGDLDIYIPSGMSNPIEYWPDGYLSNEEGGFVDRLLESGLEMPLGTDPGHLIQGMPAVRSSRAAAVADFDEDGDLDLVVMTWTGRPHLFRNDLTRGHHWLAVDIDAPDAEALTASVELTAGGVTQVRWVGGLRSYLSESTRKVHFGIGEADAIDEVTVHWLDGTSTTETSPAIDRVLTISKP